MLIETLGTARDLGRLQEIAGVFVRHGLGDAVRRLGLADSLARAGRALHLEHAGDLARLEPPVQVRLAIEELGPTFVKLGQILAGRADLFGPEWITEFGKLHSRVPAVPLDALREQLREDLGGEPEAVFARFDAEPLAAASIAQVHRAALHDGTEVVVKVRRPNIVDTVEADLRLLARAARGSMRDGLSLADQAIAYGGGRLAEDVVRTMLGSVDRSHARTLVQALARRDGAAVLAAVDGLRGLGLSAAGTLEEMALLLQQMAVQQAVPGAVDAQDPEAADVPVLAGLLAPDETQLLYSMVLHGRGELQLMSDEYGALTMVLPPSTVITMDEPTISAAITSASASRLAARSIWSPTRLRWAMSMATCTRPWRKRRSNRARSCGSAPMAVAAPDKTCQPRCASACGR